MNRVGEIRKVRSDKKIDVKPFLPFEIYDLILRVSYIKRMPIKDVGEQLCISALHSVRMLDNLSEHFVRDYTPGENLFYPAQKESGPRRINLPSDKQRISLRFKQKDYELINNISYVLGLTVASTVSTILIHSFKNDLLINRFIGDDTELDKNRIREAKYVILMCKKSVKQKRL